MSLTLIQDIKTKGTYDYEADRKVDALESEVQKEYVKEIFKELKDTFLKHKIKFIIGEFSGGNDEGGFDDVYLADSKENLITIDEKDRGNFQFFAKRKNIYKYKNEKENKISVYYTKTHIDKNLLDILEDTILSTGCLNEYGSFAGEFRVNGTVKLDVNTSKWSMDGSQSTESWDNISDAGEL